MTSPHTSAPDRGEGAPAGIEAEERHASWLELFFDLVAVAGVAQLAHRLHEAADWRDGAAYLGLFLAFWIAWVTFTMYASVAAETVRYRTMYLAMFGMATMAACVPEATGERGTVFAAAFVLIRLLSSRVWGARGEAVVDWPTAQLALGMIPWIVSLWLEGPWRYGMWGLGLALDILLPFAVSGDRLLANFGRAADQRRERYANVEFKGGERGRQRKAQLGQPPRLVRLEAGHFDERLGLFTIIVLGEGVVQLVAQTASVEDWNNVLAISCAAFVLLICLWRLTFRYGFTGVPHVSLSTASARVVLPAHFATTAALTAVAAGLGELAVHPGAPASTVTRWTLCAGLGCYFLIAAIGGLIGGASGVWLTLWSWPGLLLCVGLGLFAKGMDPVLLVWLLNAVLLWSCSYEQVRRRTRTGTA